MFRALSIASGSTLLRRPSTLIYNSRSYGVSNSTDPPKGVQEASKPPDTGIEDNPDQTPKPKRKSARKTLTGSDGDTGTAKPAKGREQNAPDGGTLKTKKRARKPRALKTPEYDLTKDGIQGAPGGGASRTKKATKSGILSQQKQLASEATDDDGLLRYLKYAYAGNTKKPQGGVEDFKRVNIVSKSMCGKGNCDP